MPEEQRTQTILSRAPLRLLLMSILASFTALAGCAQSVGDIDRTQPNLLDKKMFDGSWYVRQTIVDVPPTNAWAFMGLTGDMEVIRWEIREDMLIGYRAYEKVPGSDPAANSGAALVGEQPVNDGYGEGYDPDSYRDNPIVAYPILGHVDVQRQYNTATGEQTNVIAENSSDRPWYDRDWMRVDWASPQVANFNFFSEAERQSTVASHWVDDQEGSEDAFRSDRDTDGNLNYFDFTERIFVEPGTSLCGYLEGDCTSAEVKVRTSFLKLDSERERNYVPQFYDDNRMGEFGYFRTERVSYDRRRDLTETGVIYLANRFDFWQSSLDAEGNEIPYADRQLRPVVYTLSPNYPTKMAGVTQEIEADYDGVFKRIVSFLREQSIEDLEADLLEQTGSACMFCVESNDDQHARMGDLRYNYLYWVDHPHLSSPLGYGPSSANPETGRIVSGMAYVYGASIDTYAQVAMDMIEALNGDLSVDELTSAAHVKSAVSGNRPSIDPRWKDRLQDVPIENAEQAILGDKAARVLERIRQDGMQPVSRHSHERVKDAIFEHGLDSLLHDPHVEHDFAVHQRLTPGESLDSEGRDEMVRALLDPSEAVDKSRIARLAAEKRNIWLADFSDPALLGLARTIKDKGLEGDDLWQALRAIIYRAVMLHEIGHTVGLRHNFGASADALNYFDNYWEARNLTRQNTTAALSLGSLERMLMDSNCGAPSSAAIEEACDAQRDMRMREYQYSSIMDYGARFNSDVHGLGKYDVAALAAGYGDIVEVFEPEMTAGLSANFQQNLRIVGDVRSPWQGSISDAVHYAQLPAVFGSSNNMARREWMTRADYAEQNAEGAEGPIRVPYIACYDEYRGVTWFCNTWDQGADPYEITQFYIEQYDNYYFFNNYARDRYAFSPLSAYTRVLDRYMLPLNNMYQQAFFDLIYGIGDIDYRVLSNLAMQSGFNHLWDILSRPEYGSYAYDTATDSYVLTSYAQGDGEMSLSPGYARRLYTRYDLESGYFAPYRVLETGHYYEQLAAIFALTSADASRLGVGRDVVSGDLAYRIPYYLVFAEELDWLFSSVFLDDPAAYGPRVVQDGDSLAMTRARDLNEVGAPVTEERVGTTIDLRTPWVIRFQALVYAMADFSSNYDLGYTRRAQVVLEGSAEDVDIVPGWDRVSVEDPFSGRIFVAYRDPAVTGFRWPAAEKIEQVSAAIEAWQIMPATNQDEELERDRAQAMIENEVVDLELMRALYEVFGLAL